MALVLGKTVQPLGIFHLIGDTALPTGSAKLSMTQSFCQGAMVRRDMTHPQGSLVIKNTISILWTGEELLTQDQYRVFFSALPITGRLCFSMNYDGGHLAQPTFQVV